MWLCGSSVASVMHMHKSNLMHANKIFAFAILGPKRLLCWISACNEMEWCFPIMGGEQHGACVKS